MPLAIRALVAFDAILGVAHVANFTGWAGLDRPRRMFDMHLEANLPAWFAAVQLAFLGMLLILLAYSRASRTDWSTWPLIPFAAIPFYLSLDEVVQLHERLIPLLRTDVLPRTGAWMLVAVPIFVVTVAVLAGVSARHWAGPRQSRLVLLGGLAVYVASAGGVEIASNAFEPYTLAGRLQVLAEEMGELLGVTLMAWGVLGLLTGSGVRLIVPGSDGPRLDHRRSEARTA